MEENTVSMLYGSSQLDRMIHGAGTKTCCTGRNMAESMAVRESFATFITIIYKCGWHGPVCRMTGEKLAFLPAQPFISTSIIKEHSGQVCRERSIDLIHSSKNFRVLPRKAPKLNEFSNVTIRTPSYEHQG